MQKPDGFDALLKLLAEAGCEVRRRGNTLSLRHLGKKGFVRLSSINGYSEDELCAVLAGEKEHTPRKKRTQTARKKNTLLIDIEAKLQAGKGCGYERWANVTYEVQAFRYLLKSEVPRKLEKYLLEGISHLQERKETIHIRLSRETITLLLQQILYIESQKHAAIIFVQEDSGEIRQYRLFASLSSLEDQLSSCGFLRIQKSYLVNMRRIQRLRCDEATLDNGMLLSVSEKNYSQLKMKYLLWKGQQ